MHIGVEQSFWTVLRWTFAASIGAAAFVYILAQLGPATAVAG